VTVCVFAKSTPPIRWPNRRWKVAPASDARLSSTSRHKRFPRQTVAARLHRYLGAAVQRRLTDVPSRRLSWRRTGSTATPVL
jgi:hypothetical protein